MTKFKYQIKSEAQMSKLLLKNLDFDIHLTLGFWHLELGLFKQIFSHHVEGDYRSSFPNHPGLTAK
jgi:hypothetical protein